MTTSQMTTEELKDEKKSLRIDKATTKEECDKLWKRLFELEDELNKRGELQYVTYNED